ncbi:hypothetical protein GNP82_05970 [Aliivibrio fischeri]|uniref:Uncharacterized protein n=1 Tax=Aliivibrio fischeri TaxID=668 RepID=A0A6N3YYB5_ALIFS|nr:hypothetical protein [Aliivibrio fischeri]MUK37095.1 hypothetical protein [Aliivibrio fischeri]MUK45606.1 hypothetical protein [Aliivibrio fischeri]MUK81311.1 hypothetical protein [Aliivibrio fischeri]MUK84109.1 hypothetical protein [Aliivibrio fischeri]MUL00971.1 hypothetical protein [Aliivibrio fischeri]
MFKEWEGIIKITGSVGLVGLLFALLMQHFFSEQIISLLGSDRVFIIIVALVAIFFILMIIALSNRSRTSSENEQPITSDPAKKEIIITYRDNANHHGDNKF